MLNEARRHLPTGSQTHSRPLKQSLLIMSCYRSLPILSLTYKQSKEITMNTVISEKHFKNSSARLRKRFEAAGEIISHAQSLQELSNILFEKPYEEIKATILSQKTSKKNEQNTVIILQADAESILVVNGEYITCDFPGTDMNMGHSNLFQMGVNLANQHNTVLQHFPVPISDIEDFETDDIIKRAEKMGYFNSEPSLFKTLLMNNDLIFIVNGNREPYNLDGDWIEKVEEEGEDAVVWHMEHQSGFEQYEFFITFKELCEAQKIDEKTWVIKNKISHDITINIELKIYQ